MLIHIKNNYKNEIKPIFNYNVMSGGCFLFRAWEAMIVGMIGAFITCTAMPFLDKFHIDDPVGAAATHGVFNLIF